jgi:hypothetical protein
MTHLPPYWKTPGDVWVFGCSHDDGEGSADDPKHFPV